MEAFLKQVTNYYFDRSEGLLFVFPNHRSEIFFQSYFEEKMLENQELKVALMPRRTTIADLFSALATGCKTTDQITLLTELYEVYAGVKTKHGQTPESIDDFIFWGSVILSDFGDIDRYMVDAEQLLVNVSEYKNIAVDYTEFANPDQIEAINLLIGHLGVGSGEENVKEFHKKFIAIWDLLYEIYSQYKKRLVDAGLAYDGMLQRQVVESLKNIDLREVLVANFGTEVKKVVFVGLNALSTAEKELLKAFRDRGLAEFCWDYPSDNQKIMLSDPANKASFFIEEYLKVDSTYYFPQAFPVKFGEGTEFKVVSTNSDILACKLIPEFLKEPVTLDKKTLIMLPDEGLLPTVLTSFPQVEGMTVNVTMGASLALTQSFVFLKNLLSLFDGPKPKVFYHKLVWDLFASSLFASFHGKSVDDINKIKKVKDEGNVYVSLADLDFSPVFSKLPLTGDGQVDTSDLLKVVDYLKEMLVLAGRGLSSELVLERQAIFEVYKNINILADKDIVKKHRIEFSTFKALLLNLISGLSVPYHGEPLGGLQVMGPLEVRALDFENIMILSASENTFPRKNVADSFIPYTLRKAFEMPTYEHQDAIWAYYFYRLVSRAKNVWMVYNNVSNGLKSGEPSRYIMQLKYGYRNKYGLSMSFATALPEANVSTGHKEYLNDKPYTGPYSPSLYQTYLKCPLMFYYKYIERIDDDADEVSEDIEGKDIGNIVHESMEELYGPFVGKLITAADIVGLRHSVPTVVEKYLRKELRVKEIDGKYLLAYNTAKSYVFAILDQDESYTPFTVVGLEQELRTEFEGATLKGFIDRIDEKDGTVRVVDYKTGYVLDEDLNPKRAGFDKNVRKDTIDKIFEGADKDKWPKVALQLFIYDYLWNHLDDEKTKVYNKEKKEISKDFLLKYKNECLLENAIYCPYSLEYKRSEGKKISGRFPDDSYQKCEDRLRNLHKEILGCESFVYREGCKACEYCKYQTLCKK